MKILHIHDNWLTLDNDGEPCWPNDDVIAVGGSGMYIAGICRELTRRGHEVAMATLNYGGADAGTSEHSHMLDASPWRNVSATRESFRLILQVERPDMIHLHSSTLAMAPQVVSMLMEFAPLVCTLHDVTLICFRMTKRLPNGNACHHRIGLQCILNGCYRPGSALPLKLDGARVISHKRQRLAYSNIPITLTPSDFLRDELIFNGFIPERVRTLELFSRFDPVEEMPPGASAKDPCHLLFVGRWAREKGAMHYLNALSKLGERNWEAVVAGDGPLEGALRKRIEEPDLKGRVRLERREGDADPSDDYRACDIAVFPSLIQESFGMVGVEAMSFGKPVAAFDTGGVRQWLDHGGTGLLAPAGDIGGLAKNLRYLIDSPETRRKMGRRSLQSVRERFTLERHAGRLLEIYEESAGLWTGART